MKQQHSDAINEVSDESVLDSSFKISKINIENPVQGQSGETSRKNLHLSLKKQDTKFDEKNILKAKKSTSIDVNALKSLSNKSPQSKFFDQSFFYNEQKLPSKVIDEFNVLSSFVGDLNKKISSIVVQSEADFLRVYKQQMKELFSELLKLKRRIEDEDFKLKTNNKILVLTEEKVYFQRQAYNLDKICREAEQQNQELIFKNKILKEDLIHYQGLLIDTKKENKLLKSELLFFYENQKMIPQNLNVLDILEKENKLNKDPLKNSFQNLSEQIFGITNIQPKNEENIQVFKRSSSQNQLSKSLVKNNSLPCSPANNGSRKQQFQNIKDLEQKKFENIINDQKKQSVQKKFENSNQDPKQILQENSMLKNHLDLLNKTNSKFKIEIQSKGSNLTDLDKTRPESGKKMKKEQIYKKQLNKLSMVFKQNNPNM